MAWSPNQRRMRPVQASIHSSTPLHDDEQEVNCVSICTHSVIHDGFLSLCFFVSPSASRAVSPGPHEESAAPVTRSRRRVTDNTSVAPHVSTWALEEEAVCVFKTNIPYNYVALRFLPPTPPEWHGFRKRSCGSGGCCWCSEHQKNKQTISQVRKRKQRRAVTDMFYLNYYYYYFTETTLCFNAEPLKKKKITVCTLMFSACLGLMLLAPSLSSRSKIVSAPPPIAKVDLISPLPSPVDPLPRVMKRTKEGEAPGMNLRRKRIMDAVFTKPVTRRKKLWGRSVVVLTSEPQTATRTL